MTTKKMDAKIIYIPQASGMVAQTAENNLPDNELSILDDEGMEPEQPNDDESTDDLDDEEVDEMDTDDLEGEVGNEVDTDESENDMDELEEPKSIEETESIDEEEADSEENEDTDDAEQINFSKN